MPATRSTTSRATRTPGQTTGQGNNSFGSPWWVVSPAGKALQN